MFPIYYGLITLSYAELLSCLVVIPLCLKTPLQNHRFLHVWQILSVSQTNRVQYKWAVTENRLQLCRGVIEQDYFILFFWRGGGIMQLTVYYVDLYVR